MNHDHSIGSFGTPIVHVGVGPCFCQNASGKRGACAVLSTLLGTHFSNAGSDTPVGIALQYCLEPGLARYC